MKNTYFLIFLQIFYAKLFCLLFYCCTIGSVGCVLGVFSGGRYALAIGTNLRSGLAYKAKEMGGFSVSDAVRVLLQNALEQPNAKEERKLLKQLLRYNITAYYMIQLHLINTFEEGLKLNDQAHDKANKVLEELLKKTDQT